MLGAVHRIARYGFDRNPTKRSDICGDLSKFPFVELPRARHFRSVDSFLNDLHQRCVVRGAPELLLGEDRPAAAASISAMT